MTSTKEKNPLRGSKFEDYLAETGLLKEATAVAKKRVRALHQHQRMRSVEAWKQKQLKNPAVKAEYDALEAEFALASKQIAAKVKRKR